MAGNWMASNFLTLGNWIKSNNFNNLTGGSLGRMFGELATK
jgi:hypothetical protein